MSYPTYATILAAVQAELDLEDEVFITPTDLMNFCNQAIHEAESIILKLNEDYFLTKDTVSLVSGTADYDMPSDIYANKIRKIVYSDGSKVYEVLRMRMSSRFLDIALSTDGEDYRYMLKNDATNGFQMTLYPTPVETDSTRMTRWYIREANRVTSAASEIEIPEFRAFIEKYMIMRALGKEGNPKIPMAVADVEAEKTLMIDTLTERVPDDQNEIEMDMTHYQEHN